jgi:single-stranded DNA-binding protein
MNKCIFIGNFVHDPRLNTHTKENHQVVFTNFKLAVQHKFKKGNGETGSITSYLNFEAWDSGAEVICSRFKKGDRIWIEAMAKTYRDKEDTSKSNTVFRVESFEFIPQ